MDEYQAIGIAFACGLAVFIIAGYFVFWRGRSGKQRLVARAKASGCVARGTAVDTRYVDEVRVGDQTALQNRSSAALQSRMRVTYSYEVGGLPYEAKVWYGSPGSTGATIDYPRTVDIYYDRARPSRCVASSENLAGSQKERGFFITVLLAFAATFAVFRILVGLGA